MSNADTTEALRAAREVAEAIAESEAVAKLNALKQTFAFAQKQLQLVAHERDTFRDLLVEFVRSDPARPFNMYDWLDRCEMALGDK